jgi:ribosomal protein S18 acetylase RimI-like enzyme
MRASEDMRGTIRQATMNDADAITTLTRSAYAKWVPLIGREPLPMKVDYMAALASHRFDLLFVGTRLAGLIETAWRADDLLIENVAVAPDFQKQGHGRRLLDYAERLAVDAGLLWVRLYTNSRFEDNLRLYSSLGYEIEREEALNGGVAIHMVKHIA